MLIGMILNGAPCALRPLVKNAYHILPLALKVLPDSLSSQVKAFLSTTMVFTMAEGTRCKHGQVKGYKSGIVFLAEGLDMPVVPVVEISLPHAS